MAAWGCSFFTSPSEIPMPTVERFPPFPQYRGWWSEVEDCSGEKGNFESARFFVVVAPLSESQRQYVCGPGP